MRYKKYLAIMLVTFLMITSFASVSSARLSFLAQSDDDLVVDKGTIECTPGFSNRLFESEKIYYITGEGGTEFMGRVFRKYIPLNMNDFPEFKEEGLKVEFEGEISLRSLFSTNILQCIRLKALPIVLKDIREVSDEPDYEIYLDFDIAVKESNMVGEPIPVIATLTNKGECAVGVSEMGLEVMTLNFTITTPDNLTLSFNDSRRVRRSPEVVNIQPGRPYVIGVENITEPGLFVDEEGKDYFFVEGEYSIYAHYYSGEYAPFDENGETFEGELESKVYAFEITIEEPENVAPVSNPGGPYVAYLGEEILLDGSGSYDLDGEIVEWQWSYTNGDSFPTQIGTEESVTYLFPHLGEYTVRLKVVDDKGAEDTVSTGVTIAEEPVPEKAVLYGSVKKDPLLPINAFVTIEGATIVATNAESSKKYTATSNSRGDYELEVDAGEYVVVASKEGFEDLSEELIVKEGETKELNFVLRKTPVELSFEIILERDKYKAGEPISVISRLTNNGAGTVKIREMSLKHKTLDFIIVTPSLRKIQYFGEIASDDAGIIELAPGESYDVTTDITDKCLGNEEGFFDFSTPGRYSILGIYISNGPTFGENTAWHGILHSQLESFELGEE